MTVLKERPKVSAGDFAVREAPLPAAQFPNQTIFIAVALLVAAVAFVATRSGETEGYDVVPAADWVLPEMFIPEQTGSPPPQEPSTAVYDKLPEMFIPEQTGMIPALLWVEPEMFIPERNGRVPAAIWELPEMTIPAQVTTAPGDTYVLPEAFEALRVAAADWELPETFLPEQHQATAYAEPAYGPR